MAAETSVLLQAEAGVVQQVARGEVVAAVGHDVVARDDALGIVRGEALVVRLARVTSGLISASARRALSTLETPTSDGAVNHLALQVGEVDRVVVDHAQGADPGRREILQEGCAETAGADHQHLGGDQPRLARCRPSPPARCGARNGGSAFPTGQVATTWSAYSMASGANCLLEPPHTMQLRNPPQISFRQGQRPAAPP